MSKIQVLQEITDWGSESLNEKNGVYYVNDHGHLVGYNGKMFKSPMKQFSKARRKFEVIGELTLPYLLKVIGELTDE